MSNTLSKKLPLVCPFCDEPAYQERRTRRVITPHKIYTLRKCPTGHEFYSVEEVPEDQSAIVKEVRAIRKMRLLSDDEE